MGQSESLDVEVGDIVKVREDNPSAQLVVVNRTGLKAGKWKGPREGKTLAERYPECDPDAEVVVTVKKHILDDYDDRWDQRERPYRLGELFDDGVSFEAHPLTRLEVDTGDEANGSDPVPEELRETREESDEPSRLLQGLKRELEQYGGDTEYVDDQSAVRFERMGESYIIAPGSVEGEGYYRDELEKIAGRYDL